MEISDVPMSIEKLERLRQIQKWRRYGFPSGTTEALYTMKEYVQLQDQRMFDLIKTQKRTDIEQQELEFLQFHFLFRKEVGVQGIKASSPSKDSIEKGIKDYIQELDKRPLSSRERDRVKILRQMLHSKSVVDYQKSAVYYSNPELRPIYPSPSFTTRINKAPQDKKPGLFEAILHSFKNLFNNTPIKNADGSHTLTFPSEAKAMAFCKKQAKIKGRAFTLTNENKDILAISTGDKLYDSQGMEFQWNDTSFSSIYALKDKSDLSPQASKQYLELRNKQVLQILHKKPDERTEKEKHALEKFQKEFLFDTTNNPDLKFSQDWINNKYKTLQKKEIKTPEEEELLQIISQLIINKEFQFYTKPSAKAPEKSHLLKFPNGMSQAVDFSNENEALEYCRMNTTLAFELYDQDTNQLLASSDGEGRLKDSNGNEIGPEAQSFPTPSSTNKFTGM